MHFEPAHNARTLSLVNFAGVSLAGKGPAFSLNEGDNDGFYSMDSGVSWSYQQYGGSDNDCSLAGPLQANAMLVFTLRWDTTANPPPTGQVGQTVSAYFAPSGQLADPAPVPASARW